VELWPSVCTLRSFCFVFFTDSYLFVSLCSVALQLTGGHVPEGVTFPDDSKDFSTLLVEDVSVGQRLVVTPAARECEEWVPEMEGVWQLPGKVKSIAPADELVLLEFYDERNATVSEYWFPVETLKTLDSTSAGSADGIRCCALSCASLVRCLSFFCVCCRLLSDACKRLEETESALSKLFARRAIFSLLTNANWSASFLKSQCPPAVDSTALRRSLERVLEFVYLSASESISLSSVADLGEATRASQDLMRSLQSSVAHFLNASGHSRCCSCLCRLPAFTDPVLCCASPQVLVRPKSPTSFCLTSACVWPKAAHSRLATPALAP
jgi:hypothetical protein